MTRLLVFACVGVVAACGCRNGSSSREGAERPPAPVETPAPPPTATGEPKAAPPGPIVIDVEEPDRWVFAEQIQDGTEGGFVTGSFDEKRNRIEIRTKDLRGFAIDTSRIPIDWQRLVVISIDGANSELRRRNQDVLHFTREQTGRWVVREP